MLLLLCPLLARFLQSGERSNASAAPTTQKKRKRRDQVDPITRLKRAIISGPPRRWQRHM
jgi:hypothetical protein